MLKEFIIPRRYEKAIAARIGTVRAHAIIPCYKPQLLTCALVADLIRWNPHLDITVVDDGTPRSDESGQLFRRMAALSPRVTVLRNSRNALKAGALNFALAHIRAKAAELPEVIITLDDDVIIEAQTIPRLIAELMAYSHLGAACSQCRVANKNANILTRLQGLEYHGFNVTRLADEGFYQGPLVMHGMLTAFRAQALFATGGFRENHLIEDYEMTVRLKAHGWSVKAVPGAIAWTEVPETLGGLWRQRARWSYGGISVVKHAPSLMPVLQDLIGHAFFIITVGLIDLLVVLRTHGAPLSLPIEVGIIGLTLVQLSVWYSFQLWLLRSYAQGDGYDLLLRATFFPEFFYGNFLALCLTGAYLFLCFTTFKHTVRARSSAVLRCLGAVGTALFGYCGYTERWGTRASQSNA